MLTQGEVWPDIRGAGADRSDGRRRPTAAIWRICAYRYSEGLVLTYEGLVLTYEGLVLTYKALVLTCEGFVLTQ